MNMIWRLVGIIGILLIGYLLSNKKRVTALRIVFGGLRGMAPTRLSDIVKFGVKSIITKALVKRCNCRDVCIK